MNPFNMFFGNQGNQGNQINQGFTDQQFMQSQVTLDAFGNPMAVRVTKQDLVNYIQQNLMASEVVKVDDFETRKTRHICPGTTVIQLLESTIFNVPTPNGLVPVGVIFCPNCRKLWIDKNTLDFM